jgi:hypothetical protein
VHFSNCRRLILGGWRAVLIECDEQKHAALTETYKGNPRVVALRATVDDRENRLETILARAGVDAEPDFVSVDIDGLDYYVLRTLGVRPRLICVEVNAGHSPEAVALLPRDVAAKNIGQPLQCFCAAAKAMGYDLVCYTGNAFFVRDDLLGKGDLPSLTAVEAYKHHIGRLRPRARRWMYLVNRGLVPPFHSFSNRYLSRELLGLSWLDLLLAGVLACRFGATRLGRRVVTSAGVCGGSIS